MRRGRGRAKRGRRPQDMITRLGTSFWAGVGQRLGSSLEVPGLGRAGQMLQVLGWRFWEDLVRCWPNVFNLGALPVPCQDRFFVCIFIGFPDNEVTFQLIFTGFAESRSWECRVFSFKIALASHKSRVFPFTFAPSCRQSYVLYVFLHVLYICV